VWVAGNVADVTAGVMQSAASGVSAAVAINAGAIAEPTATPGVHYVRELLELARGRNQNPLAALRAAKSLARCAARKVRPRSERRPNQIARNPQRVENVSEDAA